jgi:MscS family membrane protein
VFGFLQAAQSGKYQEAAKYLQLSNSERAIHGERLAEQLHELMSSAFVGRVGAISDHPEGSVQEGVPRDHERIGVLRFDDSETDVDLVRVSAPSGSEIWLFSSELLAKVPDLSDRIEISEVESKLPNFLETKQVLSTPLWRLIAFVLLIPISLGVSWGIAHLVRAGQRVWLRWRHHAFLEDVHDSLAAPATIILTVVLHLVGVHFLRIPLLIRVYYQRVAAIVLIAGTAWLVLRLISRWGERARIKTLATSGYRSGSILLLGQRILKVLVGIVALLIMINILGFDMTAAIAGLGIGSVAIAFAAQKTLENLLGGISIIGDEVIRVGEVCRIGGQIGTIEDISLRSTRIRTLDRTELSVPNGQLANMNVENLSRRDASLFQANIGLRYETSLDQLRLLLKQIPSLLRHHPKVDSNFIRVRFVGFGESSLDIEINCHILTSSLEEFLAIREELLLRIIDVIAEAGVVLALPSRTVYLTHDRCSDAQQTAGADTASPHHRGT